jgi:RNA polymerase-binding transcription factor DksA
MTHLARPLPSVAEPLTSMQRMMLRDLLDAMWRDHVVQITNLAVRFHTDESPDVAAELAGVRRRLVDIESALDRLDARTYGRCDGCDRRIAFEQLEASPARRYCLQCQPSTAT